MSMMKSESKDDETSMMKSLLKKEEEQSSQRKTYEQLISFADSRYSSTCFAFLDKSEPIINQKNWDLEMYAEPPHPSGKLSSESPVEVQSNSKLKVKSQNS